MVKARSTEDLSVAERQVTDLLRQRHRIGPTKEDDFTVRNLTQMLQMAEQTTNTLTMLLAAIASVSLLVGGIGIMNIMLVSVTERTRESASHGCGRKKPGISVFSLLLRR